MGNNALKYPIPLLLKKIYTEKASGEVLVEGENLKKVLFFEDGTLIFAKTSLLQERLGEILFQLGKITRNQFWNIHKLTENNKEKIGKILVNKNIISHKDLFLALIFQIKKITLSTFTLTSGTWELKVKSPDVEEDSRFKIQIPAILVEGMRTFKNTFYFKTKFINLSPTIKNADEGIMQFLDKEAFEFYKKIILYKNRSNNNIIKSTGIDEETYWENISILYLLGIVDFIQTEDSRQIDKEIEELLELYDSLKAKKLDYYKLLRLKDNAKENDIKNAYFRLAKKFHPDRLSDAPDPEIKEKANFVFAEINKAYETLSDDNKRREYDTKGYKENGDTIRENLVEKAKIIYKKAKALYNNGRFWEASSYLEEAIKNDPNKAQYYLLLGLSQSKIPSMVRAAEENFKKVMELEPWNAEPYVAMGILFFNQKLYKRAEGFFRKALSIDPDNKGAKQYLEKISPSKIKSNSFLSSIFKKK